MNSDDKCWAFMVGLVVAGVVIIFAMVLFYNHNLNRIFAENGYCEGTIPGHSASAWVKCKQ